MCISNLIFKMAFGRHDGKMNYFLRKNLPLLLGDYLDDLMDWNFGKKDYLVSNYPHILLSKELRDGVKVKAYFFKNNADNNKLAVCVHGYNSEVLQDNSPNALFYLEHGFDVLMVENRGCNISGGDYTGFAILESKDTMEWVKDFVKMNPKYEIVLQGVSLGGTTVATMSGMDDLPENVKCVVSDCPFRTLTDQLIRSAKIIHIPKFFIKPLNKICQKKAGYSFTDSSALDSVSKAKVPVLFIHGEDDFFIPPQNGKDLYEACSNPGKELLLVPKAGHGGSNFIDEKTYYTTVKNFIEKYI